MEFLKVSEDGSGFVLADSGQLSRVGTVLTCSSSRGLALLGYATGSFGVSDQCFDLLASCSRLAGFGCGQIPEDSLLGIRGKALCSLFVETGELVLGLDLAHLCATSQMVELRRIIRENIPGSVGGVQGCFAAASVVLNTMRANAGQGRGWQQSVG